MQQMKSNQINGTCEEFYTPHEVQDTSVESEVIQIKWRAHDKVVQ